MSEVPAWSELVFVMVHGPDRPMRGRIRHDDGDREPTYTVSHVEGEPMPTFARGSGEVIDVWCWGERLRIEDPDGQVRLISDGTTVWTFLDPGEPPRESPRRNVEFVVGGTELLVRTDAERWLGDDFTRPTGPAARTTYLGRAAWAVELAPPRHKPAPMQVVVDAETGMHLQRRNDAFGLVHEWTELVVGEDLDPALFTWTGPVVTWEQQREEARRERESEQADLVRWLDQNLGTRTLRVTVDAPITVHHLEEDGSLHASIEGVGSLVRRPHSDLPWDDADDGGTAHRWSDGGWDWAVNAWDTALAPGALAELRSQLGAHSRRSSP
ncbi:hypothetical protein [Nocardioides lianchengensis]|uniref:Uncharacterized protein n=1 Tax=Nocardioides lianchengensis TaxID=1045774 RepID=A0A1G6RA05_9ACTN|nr:hypothetical protein [Nocardioides lianchengensis]NYG10325.1 hypothetical protein [Nocardioides lianchengensis]SDD00867.1 hypothetical protein SAMN05421872_105193 [Nocardioides lianchengensis]